MPNLAFVSSPLNRYANNRTNAEMIATLRASPEAKVLQISGDAVRMTNTGLFTLNDTPEAEAIYLGQDDQNITWFARNIAPNETLEPLRGLMLEGLIPEHEISILAQARSMVHWHNHHGYCSNCGSKSLMLDAGYRRQCPDCKVDHFPRTDPVVIMAVHHRGKLLLGRQASWPPGMYSALAGFMEPGETIEQAVAREVLEETDIKIGKVSYLTSQPWPFPSSLMIGLLAEATSDQIKIDPAELETARWFGKTELEQMLNKTHPDGFSASHPYAIAHHLILAAYDIL
jgi:NAD+ diphosphatase